MFLSSLQPTMSDFDFTSEHSVSGERTAIQAELSYLPDFDASDIFVDVTGPYIVLEGTVRSSAEAAKALQVAQDLAGRDRVISRLIALVPSKPLIRS